MFYRNIALLPRSGQRCDASLQSAALLPHSQEGAATLQDHLLRWRLEGRGLQHKVLQKC